MLVFLSDVHLTDGSSGTTIDPRAFGKLCRALQDIIGEKPQESNIESVEIVLLGDIFDVIRSDFWLRPANSKKNPIRPWSGAQDVDSIGWGLQRYTEAIVDKIVNRPENVKAIGYLRTFQDHVREHGVNIKISYIIGNHDWLINKYPSTRMKIAQFLNLPNPNFYEQNSFPYSCVFNNYKVLARHGDYYDSFNYEGDRDASSIGDAIVIDLLNSFPEAVERDSLLCKNEALCNRVKEIDNVRPILDIPAWIQGVCNEYPGVEERLHEIWNNMVKDFFSIQFVKDRGRMGFLKMALCLTSSFSFGRLKKILGNWIVRHFYNKSDDYKGYAYNEAALKSNSVRYVVYGHTHHAEQVALDTIQIPPKTVIEKMYFNTGTWRKVFEQTAFDTKKCKFIGWYVMTFVLFYLEEEKEKDRHYEVWSGSLDYGGYKVKSSY